MIAVFPPVMDHPIKLHCWKINISSMIRPDIIKYINEHVVVWRDWFKERWDILLAPLLLLWRTINCNSKYCDERFQNCKLVLACKSSGQFFIFREHGWRNGGLVDWQNSKCYPWCGIPTDTNDIKINHWQCLAVQWRLDTDVLWPRGCLEYMSFMHGTYLEEVILLSLNWQVVQ